MHTLVEAARSKLGIELSKDILSALRVYETELLGWNEHVNLTAIRDAEGVRIKHFLDSLTILKAWERTRLPSG
jgi:16S rRNA (guanine527-N7)-methyltransferase